VIAQLRHFFIIVPQGILPGFIILRYVALN